jgi:transcriptional regulator with XRE-family HTH domain
VVTLSNIERGDNVPTLSVFLRLVAALGIGAAELADVLAIAASAVIVIKSRTPSACFVRGRSTLGDYADALTYSDCHTCTTDCADLGELVANLL